MDIDSITVFFLVTAFLAALSIAARLFLSAVKGLFVVSLVALVAYALHAWTAASISLSALKLLLGIP